MKIIKLSDGQESKVDDWNFEYLNQFVWHPVKIGKMTYAGRIVKNKGKEFDEIILMHDDVLQLARIRKLN